ncbi:hypothetical protein KC323_g8356 [Hortaea werneckii]|nr:hypothetical protein KC323_g8356 [Hortaea werneckii]
MRFNAWHRTIPFVQPGAPETKDPPPTSLPYRQKRITQPQPETASQPPIPDDLVELAHYINHLPRNPRGRKPSAKTNNDDDKPPSGRTPSSSPSSKGFPSRNTLKRDPKLKGAISRKTGCLLLEKSGARLRGWWGDERLFSMGLWRFLTEEGREAGREGLAVGSEGR